jgi:predicted TIM-barrel enzyme
MDRPIYELEHAAERVSAAAKTAHTLPFAFTLTRLQAFQEAGADILYAPGLITKEDIAAQSAVRSATGKRGSSREIESRG